MSTGGEQMVLLDLSVTDVTMAMQMAGFATSQILGDLNGASFDPVNSSDVVIDATA